MTENPNLYPPFSTGFYKFVVSLYRLTFIHEQMDFIRLSPQEYLLPFPSTSQKLIY